MSMVKDCLSELDDMKNTIADMPKIDVIGQILKFTVTLKNKNQLLRRLTVADFTVYWGTMCKLMCMNEIEEVFFDFSHLEYANLFCLSNIMLNIVAINKPTTIVWPAISPESKRFYRFLYNTGIIRSFFDKEYFSICKNERKKENFILNNFLKKGSSKIPIASFDELEEQSDSFSSYFDKAIVPFRIYEIKEIDRNPKKYVQDIVNWMLDNFVEGYYINKGQKEVYNHVKERLNLYCYEVIYNIYEHAYDSEPKLFSIYLSNDYLPPYADNKNPEVNRFNDRITRLEQEIPLKKYSDIEHRYFGSATLFISDIGKTLCGSNKFDMTPEKYGGLFNTIFNSGYSQHERKKNKTLFNGLQLTHGEIQAHGDHLWFHDNYNYVGSFGSSPLDSHSVDGTFKKAITNPKNPHFRQYVPMKGLTFEIKLNLSRNTKGKRRAYKKYGVKFERVIAEINDMFSTKSSSYKDNAFFVYDLKNDPLYYRGEEYWNDIDKKQQAPNILYRTRAVTKDHMSAELKNRLTKMKNLSTKKYFFVFDLTQTEVFQMRAAIETHEISDLLAKLGIRSVVLISRDAYAFVLPFSSVHKQYILSQHSNRQHDADLFIKDNNGIFTELIKSVFQAENDILNYSSSNSKSLLQKALITGEIKWSQLEISSYLDVRKLLTFPEAKKIILRLIVFLDGILGENVRTLFFEDYMTSNFTSFVNEFDEISTDKPCVYIGSLIFTETSVRQIKNDVTNSFIYLFSHPDRKTVFPVSVLDYPVLPTKSASFQKKYRRKKYTGDIRENFIPDETIEYFLGDSNYKKILTNLDYDIGFFNNGYIKPQNNFDLFNAFFDFVSDVISKLINITPSENIDFFLSPSFIDFMDTIKFNEGELYDFITNKMVEHNSLRKISIIYSSVENLNDKNLLVYLSESFFTDFISTFSALPIGTVFISVYPGDIRSFSLDSLIKNKCFVLLPLKKDEGYIHQKSYKSSLFFQRLRTFNALYRDVFQQFLPMHHDNSKENYEYGYIEDINNYVTKQYEDNFSYIYICVAKIIADAISEPDTIHIDESTNVFISLLQYCDGVFPLNLFNTNFLDFFYTAFRGLLEENPADNILLFISFFIMYQEDIFNVLGWYITDIDLLIDLFPKINSKILRSSIALLLKNKNDLSAQKIVDEVFYNKTIYSYTDLYSLWFNEFGDDHDGLLSKFLKDTSLQFLLDKGQLPLLQQEIEKCEYYLSSLSTGLSQKPFIEDIKSIREIIENFENGCDGERIQSAIKKNLLSLQQYSYTFFNIISKNEYTQSIKKYINDTAKINEKLIFEASGTINSIYENKDIQAEFCGLAEYIIPQTGEESPFTSGNPEYRKIAFCNNFELNREISSLILDAYKHNTGKFKVIGHAQERMVSIYCKLTNKYLIVSILNKTDKEPWEVQELSEKRNRSGKYFLRKFNVNVIYRKNIDFSDDPQILEKRLEIPLFR